MQSNADESNANASANESTTGQANARASANAAILHLHLQMQMHLSTSLAQILPKVSIMKLTVAFVSFILSSFQIEVMNCLPPQMTLMRTGI